MKFVSFLNSVGEERAGLFLNNQVIDLQKNAATLGLQLPSAMAEILKGWERNLKLAKMVERAVSDKKLPDLKSFKVDKLLAPVPHPISCRDGYAFRQHVATARRNRNVEMIPEFDQYPIFYFTNHNSIVGEGEVSVEIDHLQQLDFELEAAIVIGKAGRNIESKDADSHIAGFTIMNDLSARVLQMEEMKLNLGPAKGKDFATAIGPWIVTPDELEQYRLPTPFGNTYDLEMKAFHNGKEISRGNLKDMNWTFAEIIERASYGVDLYPGDVIGSGTVGTGCYLELNGTWALEAKATGAAHTPVWLNDGDSIDLEITGLGRLKNTIVKVSRDYSILAKKKALPT
ncbi:MAG: fumarylacetoacetate hydrolase family protein [candidate division Zixibacteria bacterium]|nr:fumarylacetoacetate hydrolase family protein [candidate division Zixibacteria bacterium]